MDELLIALREAGGAAAPRERTARLRDLLAEELRHGAAELELPRSGRTRPVTVGLAASGSTLLAVVPVPGTLRADPGVASERGWLLTAATLGALVELAGGPPPTHAAHLTVLAGVHSGMLTLRVPTTQTEDPELAVLAFEDHARGIVRLRARALALPPAVLDGIEDERPPVNPALRGAEAVARLGGHPADAASVAEHEDAALALLESGPARVARPHEDPDPVRRAARRILQRLDGMGKWGGYHTDITHLSRGFAPSERGMVDAVGARLLEAGLLASKPSVGQRHVYLNPRRAGDIHRFIEEGALPAGLELPQDGRH